MNNNRYFIPMAKKISKLTRLTINQLLANEPACVLSMSADEAMDFMMKSGQYHEFELPEYYNFDGVLSFVRETVGEASYEECRAKKSDALNDKRVNFDVLMNKDGKYGVRPLMLTNPYLYYFLVREMCCDDNWRRVQEHFEKCDLSEQGIFTLGLPVVPRKVESFYRSTTILNWWNTMEQRSLQLSLEYNYMFVTDITNCYGCVNPQSIEWTLNRKGTSEETDANTQFAQRIITYLKDMQQGRNVGIPQGGAIFNIVGEMILSYCDLLLYERLRAEEKIAGKYVILRYRDDYKVYSNDMGELKRISYILQEVLESLNFRMNTDKTRVSSSIVTDTLKPDKLHCISAGPVMNSKWCAFQGLQKHLLYILMFSRKYPNSGQLKVMLSDFMKRVKRATKRRMLTKSDGTVIKMPVTLGENVRAICAVAVQIAVENVTAVHYVLRVISRLLDTVGETEREEIICLMRDKLATQYNSTYTQLWLQNMSYVIDKRRNEGCPYEVSLCKLTYGEDVELWDNSWLKPKYTKGFPLASVVDRERLENYSSDRVEIVFKETRSYLEDYDDLVEAVMLQEQAFLDGLGIEVMDDVVDLDYGDDAFEGMKMEHDIDIDYEMAEHRKRIAEACDFDEETLEEIKRSQGGVD